MYNFKFKKNNNKILPKNYIPTKIFVQIHSLSMNQLFQIITFCKNKNRYDIHK